VLAFGLAGNALAEKEWTTVGSVKAGTESKTIQVQQQVSKIAIQCTDGTVTIETLTVNDGTKNIPFTLSSRLNKDEIQQMTVGDKLHVSSIVVKGDGKGDYDVRIKK